VKKVNKRPGKRVYIKSECSLNLLKNKGLRAHLWLTDVKLSGTPRAGNHFLPELRKAVVEL
jgi:hypothetical protein